MDNYYTLLRVHTLGRTRDCGLIAFTRAMDACEFRSK